jgi:hypothetical protein
MREIESIEDWKGQDVVDVAEQKVGKLEDVWFRLDEAEPVLISARSGLLGRRHHLVPLQGSTVTRSFVRVAFTKEQIEDAPQNDDDRRLSPEELAAVTGHYGVDLDGPTDVALESGESRSARIRAAREAGAAAIKAEEDAGAAAVAAEEAEDRARAARTDADEARRYSDAEDARARDLRQKADAARVPAVEGSTRPGVDA